ncbi:MAG TPA: [FeFe] hydrogenase H-cluster radical SAM maturase HydE [Clostridiales bacterium]|nr:[FeFe] hydrogenase H-cluster radical SAM maturase HydE [Clostridiales bacterium]
MSVDLVNRLKEKRTLDDAGFLSLLQCEDDSALIEAARGVAVKRFGNGIYIRGLIEFTNYCKNDCYYCGIRKGNKRARRYRLTQEEVLYCCARGYELGFRTFVLQGGEDPWYTVARMTALISAIKGRYPDCALTLSFGEHSKKTYRAYKAAGADRYLLRHETADAAHYGKLHPAGQTITSRINALLSLKEAGFQVGTGVMVGSPYQTDETLLKDIRLFEEVRPHMLGVGPYLPHADTPFANHAGGSLKKTVKLIAMLRLMFPNALIPATTALATIAQNGREQGILAGANVVMPNLSPADVREKYMLYDGKAYAGEEAAESLSLLKNMLRNIGYEALVARGDYAEEL